MTSRVMVIDGTTIKTDSFAIIGVFDGLVVDVYKLISELGDYDLVGFELIQKVPTYVLHKFDTTVDEISEILIDLCNKMLDGGNIPSIAIVYIDANFDVSAN